MRAASPSKSIVVAGGVSAAGSSAFALPDLPFSALGFGSPFPFSSAACSSSLSGANGEGSLAASTASQTLRETGLSTLVMSSQGAVGPKSVEAVNQRYLPEASKAGKRASARPSVTCRDCFAATSWTKSAWTWVGSRFE